MKPDLEDVLFFHTVCIELYGGASGVRDEDSLDAAVARPWLVVGGKEAFPSPHAKAAAICESIIRRHPFVDATSVPPYPPQPIYWSDTEWNLPRRRKTWRSSPWW